MPRGIPNVKRDDTGMRYTMFHVPLAPNPKHVGTTYLKSEAQTLWARNAKQKAEDSGVPQQERRGSRVIVIHPGSRTLRIGKASDVNPVSVPNVIARKTTPPVPPPTFVEGISRPSKGKSGSQLSQSQNDDEYAVPVSSNDPFDAKVAAITVSLRDRMRFYKLRVTPNAASIASEFNEQFKPESMTESNDLSRIDWIQEPVDTQDFLALHLEDPQRLGYVVRWPIHGTQFNTRNYPSHQMILSDIETILRATLKESLELDSRDYKDYSVVLVIPDFYERAYIRDFINLLLIAVGFKQVCVQQESLAATYGAGISNACVVDIGAVTTSISCVDEGLVLPDTRMSLGMGGNDITEFLFVMLERIAFPYRDINLARSYDWNVMEDLKARLCTLAEGDVALNLYDFVVRRPGKATEKYGLRAYDEVILAPMCIFEPRVIEFDRKRIGMHPTPPDVTEEILESSSDHFTQAMIISTQHLLPSPSSAAEQPLPGQVSQSGQNGSTTSGDVGPKQEQQEIALNSINGSTPPTKLSTNGDAEGTSGTPMDVVDVESDNKPSTPSLPTVPSQQTQCQPIATQTSHSDGHSIDICFEASKLPLDVAIFNSARAAGGDEKIRKYLQAVLVIGGTALIPGMAHALESRLQAIATPLVQNMEKVQIIPPPKDVDPAILAWKGASVLGKMDGVADLWLTTTDWDTLGMRGLKERCFYL